MACTMYVWPNQPHPHFGREPTAAQRRVSWCGGEKSGDACWHSSGLFPFSEMQRAVRQNSVPQKAAESHWSDDDPSPSAGVSPLSVALLQPSPGTLQLITCHDPLHVLRIQLSLIMVDHHVYILSPPRISPWSGSRLRATSHSFHVASRQQLT